MVAALEIWDYDPDYLPEGNNSMWIFTSNLTVGMEYDMMWVTHVDGLLPTWLVGIEPGHPNPINCILRFQRRVLELYFI